MSTKSEKQLNIERFRTLPQAVEAEQEILSAALLGAAHEVVELLNSADFYRDSHRFIFEAVKSILSNKAHVDAKSVMVSLRNNGNLEKAGGAAYLSKLVNDIPAAGSVEYYTRLIKHAAIRREIITKCNQLAREAYDHPDCVELVDRAQKCFLHIDSGHGSEFVSYSDLAYRMPEKWEQLNKRQGLTGVPSGLEVIDQVTGGYQPSDLIVIAGRPGAGKTALALCNAERAASKGYPVAFFSLEMSDEQLFCRQAARTAQIDTQKFRKGGIQPHEWQKICDAIGYLSELPLYIDMTPRLHYMEIIRRSRRATKDFGIKLIVIDHLQLIKGDRQFQRKDLELAEITASLKGLAKELNVPVIVLSQLNRNVENRDDKRPRLSDLRESGAIEEHADIVALLYRDEYYNPQTEQKGIAELNFCKNRSGRTGVVRMAWIDWRQSFENYQR